MCYCPTPTLYLNLALTGDCAFQLSPKKPHSVWFISVLKSGDMGQCPEKSPSPCNTCVIPVSLYKSMSWFVTKTRTHTHTGTETHSNTHTHTDTNTHTHTGTETHSNTHTHTDTNTHTHTGTETHSNTHTHTDTHTPVLNHTFKHTYRHKHTHTHRYWNTFTSYVFHHFRKYHNAYARFRLSVNNTYYAAFVHARAFPPNVNNADYVKYVLRYSPKWQKT